MRGLSVFIAMFLTLALLACQKTEMEAAAPAKLAADSASPPATTPSPGSVKAVAADSSTKDSTKVNDSTVTISGDSAAASADTTKKP